jgi:nucleotide-binding universal stress UspA family protein
VVSTMGNGSVVDTLRTFLQPGTLLVVGRDRHSLGRWSAGVRLAGSHGGGAVALVPEQADAGGDLGVVAGIDGSMLSEEVVRVAADLAEAAGQPLTLLHAWSAPSMWQQDLDEFAGEFADYEQMHRDTLAEATDTAVGYRATPHERLAQGRPVDELLAAAEHATALVVGSHSGSQASRFLLGSVSHELLLRCPVAVVVVLPAWVRHI